MESRTSSDRSARAIVLIGVAVMVIGSARVAEAEAPRRIMETQDVPAETLRPEAPTLLSVEVIPDGGARSARATVQDGDGSGQPIALDPETTKLDDAP